MDKVVPLTEKTPVNTFPHSANLFTPRKRLVSKHGKIHVAVSPLERARSSTPQREMTDYG